MLKSTSVAQRSVAGPNKAHIDPEKGQAWWGYYVDDGYTGNFGTEGLSTYNCAIYIPGDHDVAKDAKIYAERLWFARKSHIADLKIWLSTTLPATAEEADICCDNVEFTKGGIVDFGFAEPHAIPSSGVYVGYSFTITSVTDEDDMYPVQTSYGLDMIENAMFVSWDGSKWWSNYDLTAAMGGNWGNLAMQVLVGDNFPLNGASIKSVGSGVVAIGKTVDIPVTIQNLGGNQIYEFSYTVTNNGTESEPIYYDASEQMITDLYGTKTYNIPVSGGNTAEEGKATIKIVSVNGEENEVADGREQAVADVLTVLKASNRKTVMENFINAGDDGFSVLSHVANNRLSHDWHDEFESLIECGGNHDNYIGIMIHDRDAWATDMYINTLLELDEIQQRTQGPFIYTDIDREDRVYNYFGSQYKDEYTRRTKFGIEDDFGVSQKKTVEAEVHISTSWVDSEQSAIRSVVTTTFQYNTDDAHYALAFALTEDGKEGQINNGTLPQLKAAGIFDWDPDITNFVYGDNVVDVVFDDVLVGVDEIYNGISGSIQAPIVAGEEQYYLHKWDLSNNSFITNKEFLKVIVMLIDTRTGRIVNANRVHVGEDSEEMGIENVIPATAEGNGMKYDLMGRRVNDNYKGIVIKDGKKYLNK